MMRQIGQRRDAAGERRPERLAADGVAGPRRVERGGRIAHARELGACSGEVRAFVPGIGVPEDPVTGSLNAGIAMWLRATGQAPASYVAAQGAALGRAGRIHVHDDGEHIWVGGDTTTVIEGTVTL